MLVPFYLCRNSIVKPFKAAGTGIVKTWKVAVGWCEVTVVWVPSRMRDVGRWVVDGWEKLRDRERNRTSVVVENTRPEPKDDVGGKGKLEIEENITLTFQ